MSNFAYNTYNLAHLERALSAARLSRYLNIANGDMTKALDLHLWNAALGGSLHMPIQHFELLLRNSLHAELSETFGNYWYDTISPKLENRLQLTITAAKSELIKMRRPVSAYGLISQFTFGFWIMLLKKKYDTCLWRTCLYRAFPNAPKPLLRSRVHDDIWKIRDLRNRIVHHEPILERPLNREHNFIIEVSGWLCPDTAAWIKYHSHFQNVWNQCPSDIL